MKPLVYVAGPYTKPDPVTNTRRAWEVGLELYECGFVPLVPHLTLFAHAMHPRPLDWWYRFDLGLLAHCDAVLRIGGESTGADAEEAEAERLGIPVFRHIDDIAVKERPLHITASLYCAQVGCEEVAVQAVPVGGLSIGLCETHHKVLAASKQEGPDDV